MKKAQALIIGLLIIFTSSVALAVAGAMIASSAVSVSQNQKLATSAYNLATGCLENTLMRMDRGQFTAPPDLIVNGGNCTINITPGSGTYQILSVAEFNTVFNRKVTKKIQADVSVANGVVTLISQQEVY